MVIALSHKADLFSSVNNQFSTGLKRARNGIKKSRRFAGSLAGVYEVLLPHKYHYSISMSLPPTFHAHINSTWQRCVLCH